MALSASVTDHLQPVEIKNFNFLAFDADDFFIVELNEYADEIFISQANK